ncbi:sigma 54-interacting transcriptional regulator, partial [Methylomonas rivi]|uniref:sigma 54-interacting transcriptional regulator n=1 Tax=Methylomonas rivi TaxID=2952226 RepID=UPI003531E284
MNKKLSALNSLTSICQADQPRSIDIPIMLGESPAMQTLLSTLRKAARSAMTVLINGETGTGKELAARALHCQSPRADKPFIALNMAAIPR